jgi:hypothetical protein
MTVPNCTEKYRVDCTVTVPAMPIKVIVRSDMPERAPFSLKNSGAPSAQPEVT